MAKSVYQRFGTPALPGTSQTGRRHVVVGGETLPSIAAAYYPDEGYSAELWRQIAEYNNIDDLDEVRPGMVLAIPPIKASEN